MKTVVESYSRFPALVRHALLAAAIAGAAACTVGDPSGFSLDGERADPFGSQSGIDGTTFVHLFEWRWNDIADECENFLGPKGFSAVQVSPPNEHINHSAWWARYQPVSYLIESRSGTRAEFQSMVQRCEAVGVSIIADLVINHTAARADEGPGVAGTQWSPTNHPMYSPQDYHTACDITNYGDAGNVQNCRLVGLPDLNTSSGYVQDQIAAYIDDLESLGVKGFRIDAAKHIDPGEVQAILSKAGNPDVFLEVIGAGGEAVQPGWFTHLGRVTEFDYSRHIGSVFKAGQIRDIGNIGDGKLPTNDAIVFVDNHDNQRGHGAGGANIANFEDGSTYNLANAFMLAWPYGYPKIMSSYEFHGDTDVGPPAGGTNCQNPEFVCEHRWTTIANMVEFRNVTDGAGVSNWWDNGNNRIAFSRDDKGFIAINKESGTMNETLQTGLAEGQYCNIAAGDFESGTCTGPTVTVDSAGYAQITVPALEAVAFHVGTRMGDGPPPGDDVSVSFTCENGTTDWGQSVYVVGSVAELGSWNLANAIILDPANYPTWNGTIALPANTTIEWKCVKRDENDPNARVQWQPGANNVVQTPASGQVSASASF